jgi:hypothetical protein
MRRRSGNIHDVHAFHEMSQWIAQPHAYKETEYECENWVIHADEFILKCIVWRIVYQKSPPLHPIKSPPV